MRAGRSRDLPERELGREDELAERLDLPLPQVVHHVRHLAQAGAIELVEQRLSRGAVQRLWRGRHKVFQLLQHKKVGFPFGGIAQ